MAETFTKLFGSIIASTVWQEPDTTRITWITMLAMADKDGVISAAVPGLAHMARVSIEQCEAALATFMAPDPYSRTAANDGRRIEPVRGGWRLLNYDLYREKRDSDTRREYQRQWDRDNRARKDSDKSDSKSDKSDNFRSNPTQAEAEAEAEEDKSKSPNGDSSTALGDAVAADPADGRVGDNNHANADGDLLGNQQQGKPMRRTTPPCPHGEIIALYHELLPSLRQVRTWEGKRPKHLQARWREDPQRQDLDWWRRFFVYVSRSDFLMGRKTEFAADLEWLIAPSNIAKVIEGKYENTRRGNA
ncbi:hypothetical protein FHY35_004021 [Xanthomonas arboricola]|uniref:hypothetical protein n=1 Tax=Xanthomonas arboricola TaxID=56448 RepID=UPI00141AB961|nr:hypothetical protein [Xanthomonas arboricola]NIJ86971.1 hypothetical protein [Xanthomonas arboricola]